MKTTKRILLILLALCLLLCEPIAVLAEEESTAATSGGIAIDQDASNDLLLYGNAEKLDNGTVELTPLDTWLAGSVWYNRQIDTTCGFTTQVDFWAGGGRDDSYGGADGIVVTFAEYTGLGGDGEYLGFVPGSYGVELDSYFDNDGDPEGKHIAIIHDEVSNHLTHVMDDRVDDSQWHTLKITYTPGSLSVDLDGTHILSQDNVTLPNQVYLGISAATGAGLNQHLIRNFYMEGVVSKGESFADATLPIIVVPGIMGSKLYGSNGLVWGTAESVINIFQHNGAQISIKNDLHTTGLVKETREPALISSREYGTLDWYKNLVDFLCDQYPERDIYFFSYDWRQSNAQTAEDLAVYLDSYGIEKADFICHSMGGLVLSHYIQSNDDHAAKHVITLGTPYQGATRLLEAVLTDNVIDGALGTVANPALSLGGLTYDIKRELSGVGELSPTIDYWNNVRNSAFEVAEDTDNIYECDIPTFLAPPASGLPALQFWLQARSSSSEEQTCKKNISEWLGNLKKTYQYDGITLYDVKVEVTRGRIRIIPIRLVPTSYNFIRGIVFNDIYSDVQDAQETVGEAMETLRNMDNAYFAVGVNQKTLVGATLILDDDGSIYFHDSTYGPGDGTVPFASATMLSSSLGSKFRKFNLTHSGVAGGDVDSDDAEWCKVKEWIVAILAKTDYVPISSGESSKYTVIRVACPVDVTIRVGDEVLCSSAENYSDTASFGVMDLMGKDNSVKMFCIDTGADYEMTINGTGQGVMDCDIRFCDENYAVYDERSFEDVPITEKTVIHTVPAPGQDSVLQVDQDGDGTVDATWTAGANEWTAADDDTRVRLASITLDADARTLVLGHATVLTILHNPINATDLIDVNYVSSDSDIAEVSSEGVVTAINCGTATITATATNGMTAAIEITVIDEIPGDLNCDGVVDDVDVAQLLWHTLFPDSYEVNGYADFNADGMVDDADVAYLLWHTLFPENYPL